MLTHGALEKLLSSFSANREEAANLLLIMQAKLTRFFERRECYCPEDLIDEVINRVARRIEEGERIFNLNGYFRKVADLVYQEWKRKLSSRPLEEIPEPSMPEPYQDEEREARLHCLDHCLEELTIQNRRMILHYYQDERRAKIDHRKELADTFGIQLNALRIRAHRIRSFLEKCVENCLVRSTLVGNKTGH